MKQTAVEQFIEQLEQQGNSWENASIGRMNISIKIEDYLKLIEQAKQMEKQQIEQAFNEGDLFSHNYDESGEKYYIYTFEK
jgi:hypothetical protein